MPDHRTTSDLPRQVGLIAADPTATLLFLAAHAGLDFIVLDAEQTGLTVQDCADAVQRLAGSPTEVAIRVPDLDERTLVAYANTGAAELVLPQVRSVDQLENAYRATRFTPAGARSRQASFSSAFGLDFTHVPRLSVLFETVEAVDDVERIAESEHFEGGWLGPADLAADLHNAGRTQPDALKRSTERVVDALQKRRHSVGLPGAGVAGIAAAFEQGADRVALYWEKHLTEVIAELVMARREGEDAFAMASAEGSIR